MKREESFYWFPDREAYSARHRLSNGQYCQIEMYRYYGNRSVDFYVAFAVADKKKNLNGYFNCDRNNTLSGKMTGRCGVEALFWCRDMLYEFEKEIVPTYIRNCREVKVIVYGEDQKRQRFYEKTLPRLGFSKENTCRGYGMVKRFTKGDDKK